MTPKELARLAIGEAASRCVRAKERHALGYATDAFERGDYAEAIREAINAAYVAGMGREVRERNKSQGNRTDPETARYQRALDELAAMSRVPRGSYERVGREHKDKGEDRTPEAVKLAVMRRRKEARGKVSK
jgi:hypothetical protein